MQTTVGMFVLHPFTHEPRSRRAAFTLASAGYGVTVYALASAGLADEEYVDGVRVLRFASEPGEGPAPLRKMRTARNTARLRQAWADAARRADHDICHANNLDTLGAAVQAAKGTSAKVVYDAHELFVEYQRIERPHGIVEEYLSAAARAYWSQLERQLLQHVDAVITVNPLIAREMATRYGIAEPVVILNVPSEVDDRVLRLPDLPGVPFLYQGGLTHGRGLEDLLEATSLVPGMSLTVMGKGPVRPWLEERAGHADLAERTVIAQPVDPGDMIAFARSAEVGVIPFRQTTLNNIYASPNKLFEYMHAGLAEATSDLPYIASVLLETGAGITFEAGNVASMADVFRRLVDDVDLRGRLRAASAAAASRYNWDVEKHKLLDVYARLEAAR